MLLVLQECRVAGAYGRGPRHFHVPHGRDYFDAGNCRTCECRNGNATALCRYHMTHAHAHATALCRYHMTHAHAHATALCRYHMMYAHAHATCAHNLCTCMHMCTNNSSGLPPPFPLTSPPSPPPSSTPSLPPPLPPPLPLLPLPPPPYSSSGNCSSVATEAQENCTYTVSDDDGEEERVLAHGETRMLGCEMCACRNGRLRCTKKKRGCRVCLCVHITMYVCMYVCMYACMYVCSDTR